MRLSFLFDFRLPPHPVLDVVVDDEVQLLVREPVMHRQHPVDFVDDRLGQAWPKFLA